MKTLTLLELLEIIGMPYKTFSKDRKKYIEKWQRYTTHFAVKGRGSSAVVILSSLDIFLFEGHARREWGFGEKIDYVVLYTLYEIVMERDGYFLPSYSNLSRQLGVHRNTIGKYFNLLEEKGIIQKQVEYEDRRWRRVKALPQFHTTQ
jgi:hypothetical protein